ncbi:polyphosphate polymerase domain-containing protein [Nakamurella lactea]|uniref:polyphosphate polymerase domain-containing protein n=1 Tax=Nakamurella lactea TaxID=459515 RepID=UPI00041F6D2B|nr:polyphosphate polymerase domain-containing protein [Nakamurella lactea]
MTGIGFGPTSPAAAGLVDGLRRRSPVGLDQVMAHAALLTRVDRKYLVPLSAFNRVLAGLGDQFRALEIDGRRVFHYRSVYFDTAELAGYHHHLQGRRHRFKVRTRTYLDSGDCVLEVKAKGHRDRTVKYRSPYPAADSERLTAAGLDFVADRLAGAAPARSGATGSTAPRSSGIDIARLAPALTTGYRRATLVDLTSGSRLTCDVDLTFRAGDRTASGPAAAVLVESKSATGTGPADVLLRGLGVRPLPMSKYCLGIALVHPWVRSNPWHRTLRRHFVSPQQG